MNNLKETNTWNDNVLEWINSWVQDTRMDVAWQVLRRLIFWETSFWGKVVTIIWGKSENPADIVDALARWRQDAIKILPEISNDNEKITDEDLKEEKKAA